MLVASALFVTLCQRQVTAGVLAGEDNFPSIGQMNVMVFDPPYPGGFTELIALNSLDPFLVNHPTHVHRDAQIGSVINTEMISLDLYGTSVNVGAIHVRAGVNSGVSNASLGQITNVVSSGTTFISGDSFFDVFVEIDIPSFGVTLFNQTPVHMVANGITILPPIGFDYQNFDTTLLYVKGGGPNPVAKLFPQTNGGAAESHQPTPEPTSLAIWSSIGLLGLVAARRRKQKV
jgi:hypothetical protein